MLDGFVFIEIKFEHIMCTNIQNRNYISGSQQKKGITSLVSLFCNQYINISANVIPTLQTQSVPITHLIKQIGYQTQRYHIWYIYNITHLQMKQQVPPQQQQEHSQQQEQHQHHH